MPLVEAPLQIGLNENGRLPENGKSKALRFREHFKKANVYNAYNIEWGESEFIHRDGKMHFQYNVLTLGEGLWKMVVEVPEEIYQTRKIEKIPSESDLCQVVASFHDKESPAAINLESDRMHARGMFFTSANWQHITQFLFPRFSPSAHWCSTFGEVNFQGFGQADLIGLNSNGVIQVLEFGAGTNGKYGQVKRHEQGVKECLPEESRDAFAVFPYVVKYSFGECENHLLIHPAFDIKNTSVNC